MVPSAIRNRTTTYVRLNGLNRLSVTGMSRSMTGSPEPGSSSGLPGVARISGAEPDSPPCQMVPTPR